MVAYLGDASRAIRDRCSERGPVAELCNDYVTVSAECLAETCPNSDALGPAQRSLFEGICAEQYEAGNFREEDLGTVVQQGCAHPLVSGVINYLVNPGNGMGSGGLASLCEDGPRVAAEACEQACDLLEECIPEGTPDEEGGFFGDVTTCRWLCAMSPDIEPRTWTCISEAEQCEAAFQCFNAPPPAVPECDAFGQRVAECIVEDCPAVMTIQVGTAGSATNVCNSLVANQTYSQEQVAQAAQGACGVRELRDIANYLTITNPALQGSGFLEGVCQEGLRTPEVCQQACENLSPCIPEGSEGEALRDVDVCSLFCHVQPVDFRFETGNAFRMPQPVKTSECASTLRGTSGSVSKNTDPRSSRPA